MEAMIVQQGQLDHCHRCHHRHNFEPHSQVGVDPVMRRRIWEHLELLSNQPNQPTTTIITTHYIEEARGADR